MSVLKTWGILSAKDVPFIYKNATSSSLGNSSEEKLQLCDRRVAEQPEIKSNHRPSSSSAVQAVFMIPELLGRIFANCLTIAGPTDALPTASADEAPVLLMRVCRMWRETALGTPQLWSSLQLTCFPVVPCKMLAEKHIELLDTWMKRSGSCPLSIGLKYFGLWVSDVSIIRKILATILPYSHRWRFIDITAPMSSLQSLLPLIGPGTPLLEVCRINITSSIASEPELAVSPFRLATVNMNLACARSLQHLYIKADVDTDVLFSDIPGSGTFTHLSMNNTGFLLDKNIRCDSLRKVTLLHVNLSFSLIRTLASSLPLLNDLLLDIRNFENSSQIYSSRESMITSRIIFPSLESLTIRTLKHSGIEGMNITGSILDHISFPNLKTLILRIGFMIETPWRQLAQNLARERSPLKELSVMGICLPESEFLDILKELPELQILQACVRLTDRGAEALTLCFHSFESKETYAYVIGLCPKLVCIDIPIPTSCSSGSIITMIESRNEGTQNLDDNLRGPKIIKTSLQGAKFVLSSLEEVNYVYSNPRIAAYIENGMQLELISA